MKEEADSANQRSSSPRRNLQIVQRAPAGGGWRGPSGGALGGDGALSGSSFLRGVVGRSQAALREGKVEALTPRFQVVLCRTNAAAG